MDRCQAPLASPRVFQLLVPSGCPASPQRYRYQITAGSSYKVPVGRMRGPRRMASRDPSGVRSDIGPSFPSPARCAGTLSLKGRGKVSLPPNPLIPHHFPQLIPAGSPCPILPSLPPRWTGSRANGLRGQGRMEGVAPSLPKFRPAGCLLFGGEGRQWCHGRFRAARGRAPLTGSRGACAETSGVLAPWIWTAGISPLLREAGRSNPPVARHCGSGEIPAVRRSEVETSGRAGGARPCHYTCGLPLGPSPAGAVLLPHPPRALARRALLHAAHQPALNPWSPA